MQIFNISELQKKILSAIHCISFSTELQSWRGKKHDK